MGFYSKVDRKSAGAVDSLPVKKYSGAQDHHDELNKLINTDGLDEKEPTETVEGANRVTVIVTTPENWGGSVTEAPGHCGVVLWKNDTCVFQSCGIRTDGTGKGYFLPERVNCKLHPIKADKSFKIWYFTANCDAGSYDKMQKRMAKLHKESADGEKIGYAKFFAMRLNDHSFSCVTAVDTILAAAGPKWSIGLASQASTPWAYAQTFTSAGWYISHVAAHKHC
jgi:hypothetical protein